ncbi:MAG: TauD/TfdA family dioxygenase [Alphaproteobacteria bacterium]|nr:TauD/TfdA family dioxygenase [Alphaproteobacteria bacterium]
MAVYAGPAEGPAAARKSVAALGAAFGLRRLDRNLCAEEDGISALEVRAGKGAGEYVPYTDRALSWHTDGYYNSADEQVRGVILHCVRSAPGGGGNALMDPEIAYIRLRDENPDYIAALMHPQAMTIPPNTMGGTEIRPARVGPVFSVDERGGALHMRYSARKVNVAWRDDGTTRAAVDFLNALLAADSRDILHWRLEPGQGYISNNVLHNRTAFGDTPEPDSGRLVYRARYYDRIEGTDARND